MARAAVRPARDPEARIEDIPQSSHAFRVELSVAKILGVLALLLPVPGMVKEWSYAGFTFSLVSALIAHLAAGDDASTWVWVGGLLGAAGAVLLFPGPGRAGR